ncbi:MAG: hypothetical protein U0R81_14320 [Mycobacterium sp.]
MFDNRDNVLSYPDQAMFLAARAGDHDAAIQVCWHYRRPVDVATVKRFHGNLGHGLMGRRIERSPLPFGRHRWVSSPGPQCDLGIAERPRPPSEMFEFADEQVNLPLDPEQGPAWRLALQPFTDGSTAVLLTVSHCIADGTAVFSEICDAVGGRGRDLRYPTPHARSRANALRSDVCRTLRDLPDIGRALATAVRLAFGGRVVGRSGSSVPNPSGGTDSVPVPTVAVAVDAEAFDKRAEALGGNSHSLVAGFAVKLAARLGRVRADDGAVTLMIPVSQRVSADDTGGNVVSIARVSLDPRNIADDLAGARREIGRAVTRAIDTPDELVGVLPLVPFIPMRVVGRIADMAFGFTADLPVSCSNVGELPSELLRVDGTEAEFFWARGMDRNITRSALERRSGVLTVASARIGGKVVLVVIGYLPGQENSRARLIEVIGQTLSDFTLSGVTQ